MESAMALRDGFPKFFMEATVMSVDISNVTCKCRTSSGEFLYRVRWMPLGDSYGRGTNTMSNPNKGDKVLVTTVLGYPLIMGFLHRSETDSFQVYNLDMSSKTPDTGAYGLPEVSPTVNPGTPSDTMLGDKILASSWASLIALLRTGGIILRSTPLAQILISRVDDLVRVVSRTFEHFTVASTEVIYSIRGRSYIFKGISKTSNLAKKDRYQLIEIRGDVPIPKFSEGDYDLLDLNNPLPDIDQLVSYDEIRNYLNTGEADGGYTYSHSKSLLGETVEKRIDKNDRGVLHSVTDSCEAHDRVIEKGDEKSLEHTDRNTQLHKVEAGGESSSSEAKKDSYTITVEGPSGSSIIEVTPSSITLTRGSSKVELTDSSITSTIGASSVTLTPATAEVSSSGHSVLVNAGGVYMS